MFKKTTQKTEKLTYRQPKVYVLGSLEQLQAGYYGDQVDGSESKSYYYQNY
jgi:hypothetical protein